MYSLYTMETGMGKQIAMLVAGTINNHIYSCESFGADGSECDGCCPVCCGPCAALAWFRDNERARNQLAQWLVDWDPGWDWCELDGQIKWAEIEKHWTLTGCHEGADEARWTPGDNLGEPKEKA